MSFAAKTVILIDFVDFRRHYTKIDLQFQQVKNKNTFPTIYFIKY